MDQGLEVWCFSMFWWGKVERVAGTDKEVKMKREREREMRWV